MCLISFLFTPPPLPLLPSSLPPSSPLTSLVAHFKFLLSDTVTSNNRDFPPKTKRLRFYARCTFVHVCGV